MKSLSDDKDLSLSFNHSINMNNMSNTSNSSCIIYPIYDFRFRASRPTWIDIAISVFVVGKEFLLYSIKCLFFSFNQKVFFGMK